MQTVYQNWTNEIKIDLVIILEHGWSKPDRIEVVHKKHHMISAD